MEQQDMFEEVGVIDLREALDSLGELLSDKAVIDEKIKDLKILVEDDHSKVTWKRLYKLAQLLERDKYYETVTEIDEVRELKKDLLGD